MAAGNTYEAIATQTLGSAAASVTFSSIPSTYTDLVLVINYTAGTAAKVSFRLNGDSGSNYSRITVDGTGTGTASDLTSNNTEAIVSRFNATTSRSNIILQFMNYSNTTTNKSVIHRHNNAGGQVSTSAMLWDSTAAISRIDLITSNGATWSSATTANLYGILKA